MRPTQKINGEKLKRKPMRVKSEAVTRISSGTNSFTKSY